MGRMENKITFLCLTIVLVLLQCEGLDMDECPSECSCGWRDTTKGLEYLTNCSGAALNYVPHGIPAQTNLLDLSDNEFHNLSESAFSHLPDLTKLNLRDNPDLDNLPLMVDNEYLKWVKVDKGAMCCIFEIEWEQYLEVTPFDDSTNRTAPKCKAAVPYTECSTQLMKVFTIIIYFVVTFFSLIFNPWIMIVTACHYPRRRDPITFNAFYFSASNLFATIYSAVMVGYGIAYINDYHYHMESWLSNPGCSMVGFFLLTSTLVSAVLYMIEVICIFMKLRFPLKVDRHMTVRRLHICVAVTWAVALLIATVPFMASRRYNAVGVCLPFYSDEITGFKFVIFYTVIMGMTVAVNATLAFLLMKSFMKNRKRKNSEVPLQLVKELLAVEKKILVALSVYCLIALVTMSFLIMSCVGGDVGRVGREWYTRIVVLETITYPLIGPLRAKKFFVDTAKLLRRWNCYDFPGILPDASQTGSQGIELMKKHHKAESTTKA